MRITAVFKDGQISGSAGCNGYFGAISGEGPRDLSLGRIGATMMACPESIMVIEGRYLHALEKVKEFSFLLGRLALTIKRPVFTICSCLLHRRDRDMRLLCIANTRIFW